MQADNQLILDHLDTPMFRLIGEVADEMNRPCFVIGGYVRDIFLNRPSKDIDIVTLGSGRGNSHPGGLARTRVDNVLTVGVRESEESCGRRFGWIM